MAPKMEIAFYVRIQIASSVQLMPVYVLNANLVTVFTTVLVLLAVILNVVIVF